MGSKMMALNDGTVEYPVMSMSDDDRNLANRYWLSQLHELRRIYFLSCAQYLQISSHITDVIRTACVACTASRWVV
jgi:hypothetical protein